MAALAPPAAALALSQGRYVDVDVAVTAAAAAVACAALAFLADENRLLAVVGACAAGTSAAVFPADRRAALLAAVTRPAAYLTWFESSV